MNSPREILSAPARETKEAAISRGEDPLYLYGFARPGFASEPPGEPVIGANAEDRWSRIRPNVRGMDERHPPFYWPYRGFAAVLSAVSQDEFCGPAAEANLQDLQWIGPRACRHQAVVEEALSLGPVLPARFGTLFSSLAAVAEYSALNAAAIGQFLDQVTGREEWGVKGFFDRGQAETACLARLEGQGQPAPSPGARYLQTQRLRLKVKEELTGWLDETCTTVLNEWTRLAPDFRPRRILPPAETTDLEIVSNWAFLVARIDVAEFRESLGRVNAQHGPGGLKWELTGPWPPYSFCPTLAGPGAGPEPDPGS